MDERRRRLHELADQVRQSIGPVKRALYAQGYREVSGFPIAIGSERTGCPELTDEIRPLVERGKEVYVTIEGPHEDNPTTCVATVYLKQDPPESL